MKPRKTRKVTCAICGREFETNAPRVKYCSAACIVEGKRREREAWDAVNPNYNHIHYQNVIKPRNEQKRMGVSNDKEI